MIRIISKVASYVLQIYASSLVLCIAFLFGRYSIEINHVESRHVGIDTWLTTLIPNSIVFEVEHGFMHVHKIRFYSKS